MSSSEVAVVTLDEIPTLEVSARCTILGMPGTIGKSYHKLAHYLESKGGILQGEPFVRYLEIDWDRMIHENRLLGFFKMFTRKWVLRIGFPVAAPVEGEGEIQAGKLPAQSYITLLHTGPYKDMGHTYNTLYAYAKEKALVLQPECIEKYLNSPEDVTQEELQTIVMIPLAS